MSGQDDLLHAIASIYAAPGNAAQWSNALDEITGLVGGKLGAYILVDGENMSTDVMAFSGLPADSDVSIYAGSNGADKDIRFQYLHNLLPGKVFREFEFVPDRAGYETSEWIQFQRKHWGVYWCMSARISPHGLWRDIISVNRLYDKGQHTDEEKADLQAMLPHLSRAAELHRVLTSLERRYQAVLSVLDKLLVGLILLDHRGRVVVANNSAKAACEASGSIVIDRDSVRAHGAKNNNELQKLIAETGNTANAAGRSDGGSLVLPKRAGDGHVLVEAMPIRDDGLSDREGIQGTALFLIDPDSSQMVSTAGLAQIFKLTEAEHAVTSSLINGASVNEIAEQRSASVETVRTQLKSVFTKTGVNSQLGLMRLAVKANPPIGD